MGNSFTYKYYDWQTGGLKEKWVSDQPEAKAWFGYNNSELLDGKYTTVYGASIDESTLPRDISLNDQRYSILVGGSGNNKIRLLRGAGYNYQCFRDINGNENKVKVAINIGLYDHEGAATYPWKVFETDTMSVYVDSVSHNTDTRYRVYRLEDYDYTDPQTGTVTTIKGYKQSSVDPTTFITGANIRVLDKVSGVAYSTNYTVKQMNGTPRLGSENPWLFITLFVLDEFNPKYTSTDVTSGGYAYDLNNTGAMLQYINGGIDYSSEVGKLFIPIICLCSNEYEFNTGYDLFQSDLMDSNGDPKDMSSYILDNLFDSVYGIKNNSDIVPSSTITFYYYTYTNDSRLPSGWYGTSFTNYNNYEAFFRLSELYLPASYRSDTKTYLFCNAIASYNQPKPAPEPDPSTDPYDYEPDINVPDVPQDPTTGVPSVSSPGMYSKNNTIDISGQYNSYTGRNINGSEIKPYDLGNITQINGMVGYDYDCYLCTFSEVAKFRDCIQFYCDNKLGETIALTSSEFRADDYMTRVIELPISSTWFINYFNATGGIIQSTPTYNNIILCREDTFISQNDYKNLIQKVANLDQQTISSLWTLLNVQVAGSGYKVPGGSIKYFNRFLNRWAELKFKYTLYRPFGNYLDFTDVTYSLLLPCNTVIELDPNLIFNNANGNSFSDDVTIYITYTIDIQTGDVLISITRNNASDDVLYQASVNIAIDRSLNGTDGKAQVNALTDGFAKTASVLASLAIPTSTAATHGVVNKVAQANIAGEVGQTSYNKTIDSSRANYSRGSMGGTALGAIQDFLTASAPPMKHYTQSSLSGTSKLFTRLYPVLIIDRPDIINDSITNSVNTWIKPYDRLTATGYPSYTNRIGAGFNKYIDVYKIYSYWSYSYSQNEIEGLKNALLNGFYIASKLNVYVEPSRYYSTVIGDLGFEVTDKIALCNVANEYRNFIDRYLLGDSIYQTADKKQIIDDVFIYNDQDQERPIIDIDSSLFTHQNEAIWNGRIYNITNVEYLTGHIIRLYLQEDYITTWFYLMNIQGVIGQSSTYFMSDIKHNLPSTVRRRITKNKFQQYDPNNYGNFTGYSCIVQSCGQHMDRVT